MGETRLAEDQKKTQQLGAVLAFIDESGLLMAPLVRRTWAPRGQTPILWQRGRHRGKVSIIAAVVTTPSGRPRGLFFRLHVDQNVTKTHVLAFLRQLRRDVQRPIVVVWDRLHSHKSPQVLQYAASHNIVLEMLPPYAPELNPAEYVWAYLKTNPLANFTPNDTDELAQTSRSAGRRLQHRPQLLRSFAAQSPLFF